ncbi:uncharacterized protein CIMG_13784 [Coccidioides immitis RS]|uniref:Uncharacterized protein n=1 Tax=Coccidioides immitis (strain RS) TaxID=246410 RepID=J3KD49_COCIM|nr:uncharacterized protein CIMG_13784 [Coccidioides immitis RS]EAS33238.3 hypothetical protein CIMG_13784 [Coccidioides immitis RS]
MNVSGGAPIQGNRFENHLTRASLVIPDRGLVDPWMGCKDSPMNLLHGQTTSARAQGLGL